jgi:ribonucleoside-triphosphate reductase
MRGKHLKEGDKMVTFKSEKERLFRMIDRQDELQKKRTRTEIYSRIVGYIRPITQWNLGKISEWNDRVEFKIDKQGKMAGSTKGKK